MEGTLEITMSFICSIGLGVFSPWPLNSKGFWLITIPISIAQSVVAYDLRRVRCATQG